MKKLFFGVLLLVSANSCFAWHRDCLAWQEASDYCWFDGSYGEAQRWDNLICQYDC